MRLIGRFFSFLVCCLLGSQIVQAQQVVRLYAGKAPGSENWTWDEAESTQNMFNTRVIYNVATPTLTAYLPNPELATGTAVVIAPGGAFHTLSIDSEGIDVAKWLQAKGVASFVLTYRVVRSLTSDPVGELMPKMADSKKLDAENAPVVPLAIADGKRAIEYVRQHANELGVLPNRIGLMGFSAGGTVTMGVGFDYSPANRPDFLAPIYPYLGAGAIAKQNVPADAPPLFVCAASDDQLGLAPHSTKLYTDWLAAGKSAELHLYLKGGHGFGMRKQNLPTDAWIDRFGDWLKLNGFLKKLHPNPYEQQFTEEQVAEFRRKDEERLRTDWAYLSRYAVDNQKLADAAATTKRVVFLGNSITENWAKLQPGFFTDNSFVGRGISGQTSGQTLVRFRQDVLNLKPAAVIINIGTNDVAENSGPYNPDFTFGNIVSMVELARANNIRVILASVQPAYRMPWRKEVTDVPGKIVRLNERIKAYAQQNNFVYLDYFSALADERKGMKAAYTDDGVHPTLAGYQVMGPLAQKAIAEALKTN
ncbi:GDSL-type esterase/lipase family protein [uncultured Fibrella sp.]|uniref:GDSL-type esterase/lipase family protein n=1 Tax=uncultured Fibrella sp. TaxID=1284596 RepID=UPI0035C9D58A